MLSKFKDILKPITVQNSDIQIHVAVGLNAGNPVTDREELFEAAVEFAKRLCFIIQNGGVLISTEVRDHYKSEAPGILSNEDMIKTLHPTEEEFLNRLMDILEKSWNQPGFKVSDFCSQIGYSKSRLYRQLTALTGYSPSAFIKEFRLKKAVELIEKQQGNIFQIALETGFNNPSYFSKCFHKRFGILPSEYSQNIA